MMQDMENEARPVPSKEEIIEKVIDILVREIAFIERDEVSRDTDLLNDFKIDHDDITMFLTMTFKHFNIPVFIRDDFPLTVEGISNFIFEYIASGRKDEDPRDKQGLWGKFLKWISL
ncbi:MULTISPECIES: hypothetical protein [Burkholderia cepacia complex]|uniref:hypothetical protein n=1 Tax=Burkholderia cepacia complex TaxID=87882 RepID=UPI001B9DB0F5|nr:hypothetical protein [Burkholderia cenocepacia]MBR8320540.1 hypothetical protein [Burkholderia cenocepacia]